RIGHSAVTPACGKYGRVVFIARLRQLFEKPWRPARGRETRSSISADPLTRDLFQSLLRAQYIAQKFLRRHLIRQGVGISVRGDLVTLPSGLANQVRIALRNPSQEKTRCADVVLLE